MAEKRMFTKKVIKSDAFLDMPLSAQALYFHLNMEADDDGFLNNPKLIQKIIGASKEDLELLIAKRFLICFEGGVVVIKHWWMHNTLRKDRYTPTAYQDILATLEIKENKSYTENVSTTWQPNGNGLETQYSIDKNSIVKNSINNNILDSNESCKPKSKSVKCKYGEYNHVLLSEAEFKKLCEDFGNSTVNNAIKFLDEYIEEKGYKSKSHNLAIRRWVIDAVKEKKNNKQNSGGKENKFNAFSQRSYDYTELEKELIENNND